MVAKRKRKREGYFLYPCDGGFLWVVVECNGRARHPSVLGGSALVGSSSSNSSEVLGERVQVAGTSSGVPLRRREWMPPAKCSADSISSGLFDSFFLSSLAFSLNFCVVPYSSLEDKLS